MALGLVRAGPGACALDCGVFRRSACRPWHARSARTRDRQGQGGGSCGGSTVDDGIDCKASWHALYAAPLHPLLAGWARVPLPQATHWARCVATLQPPGTSTQVPIAVLLPLQRQCCRRSFHQTNTPTYLADEVRDYLLYWAGPAAAENAVAAGAPSAALVPPVRA